MTVSCVQLPWRLSVRTMLTCGRRYLKFFLTAHVVRVSSLRNISLRYNKISASGAVAVALMIKDYPDRYPTPSVNGSAASSTNASPTSSVLMLSPPGTPTLTQASFSTFEAPPTPPPRAGPILPPPRHPATVPQTTYTPYIPRSKRAQQTVPNPLSPTGQPIPLITSSAQGGVTARHPVPPSPLLPTSPVQNHDHGPSAALLDKVRALDALPRLGALRTLDLRGNDIRVSYALECFLITLILGRVPSRILLKS